MVKESDLTQAFNNDEYTDQRDSVKDMDHDKRILYEIERLLNLEEKNLELDYINSRKRYDARIPNKDIYRIYKGLIQELNVEQRMYYNGRHIVDPELVQEIRKSEKSVQKIEITV